ncbi:DUF3536 domain-containing protein [Fulvivirga sp. 29W222]|uniref:DUF3536 domain-containing protein n=1 Tax=Fulvivirga marina TaxID=2494733 RepID=A0A937FYR1_9BACT|nr:DUF3536 domain-containing protein [Fulvivirga marina]MBL6447472.1 DUF3536 domain-containing protein [Fulvivirga marina]
MSDIKKYLCIHGHFYQPPRENPWLNKVEIQDSAYPYHDWNHRINAECYARNSASRILNEEGKVVDIINNYAWMSFNMGPTLLAWMQNEAPETYAAILQADKDSIANFSGHGSALAQAYNHMIMPLANQRDKETQIIWGIEDFRSRFDREPEGMWLGETAVNTETLEVLAAHHIKFTILSPRQAKRFRKIGATEWKDRAGTKINSRNSYICYLPSGNSIALFFYDASASQAVAFEGLLNNGEDFASRLLGRFNDENTPQLVHIATDGESYGHHHHLGEMALSYGLNFINKDRSVELTVYGEYLEKFPPRHEVEILENTSWSCVHGVERWNSNCGCNTGGHQDWTQEWRRPLRKAFDWVREHTIALYEKELTTYTTTPWDVRNKYICVVLDRSEANVSIFLKKHFGSNLDKKDKIKLLKLLEMQYHSMLMYTSCGWFFDEVTGIESMQDIFYAARAVQLAEEISGQPYEKDFIALLEKIPSNIREYGNAAAAYNKHVKPMIVDMLRVGAHFAVSSVFEEFPDETILYSFSANSKSKYYYEAGKQKLVIGRTCFRSNITWEEIDISYAVVHMGEHNLFGGARPYLGSESLEELHTNIVDAFQKNRLYELFNLLDKYFGSHSYSFWHLFRDEQRQIMELVMENTLKNAEGTIYQLYENNYQLLQVFDEINMAVPKQLKLPIDLAINTKLIGMFETEEINLKTLGNLLDVTKRISVELDTVTLNYLANERVRTLVDKLAIDPSDNELLQYIVDFLRLIKKGDMKTEFWEAQNTAFLIKADIYEIYMERCKKGNNPDAEKWCQLFDALYKNLNLVV